MNEAQKKMEILKQVLGSSIRQGDESLFYCPYCKSSNLDKKKLSINIKKGYAKCWTCDKSFKKLSRLVKHFGTSEQLSKWYELTNEFVLDGTDLTNLFGKKEEKPKNINNLKLPSNFHSLTGRTKNEKEAREYLKSRNITNRQILRYRIGYSDWGGEFSSRIIIPSFDNYGLLNFFIARDYLKSAKRKRYWNPAVPKQDVIFNEIDINFKEDIVLVEGVFDAIVAGENAVPILGSSLGKKTRLFRKLVENDPRVFLALDPGAKKKEINIIKKLLEFGVECYKVSIDGYDDVGMMTNDVFEKRKKEAVYINQQYLMRYQMGMV
jgi:hypothetical protein